MAGKHINTPDRFSRCAGRSFGGKAVFLPLLALAVMSACSPGKMSVEEARQVAVSMGDSAPVVPPRRIGDILATLEQGDRGDADAFRRFETDIEKPPPQTNDPSKLMDYYHRRGEAFYTMGRNTEALADLRRAMQYASRANSRDDALIHHLAYAEFVSGNYKQAIDHFKEALSIREREQYYAGLVKLYARAGDLSSAERVATAGISLCNRARGQTPWPAIHAANMKAYVLETQAKFAEAEPYYRQVLRSFTRSMKKQYALGYAVAKIYLARNLKYQDRLVEAEVECRDYLKLLDGMGRASELYGHGLSELGEILIAQGRLQDAAALLETSVRLLEEGHTAADSYLMAEARMRFGQVLAAEENFGEAMHQFDLTRDDMARNRYLYENFFARNPALILSLLRTERIEEATGRISECFTKNLELYGAGHYLTGETLGFRAMAHALQHNDIEALKDFARAIPILISQDSSGMLSYDRRIRRRLILESYLGLLIRVRGSAAEKTAGLDATDEAFKLADALSGSAVRGAIGANTARAAATSADLADLVRRQQDARKQLQMVEGALAENLAAPVDQQLPEVIRELKKKVAALTQACEVLTGEINTRFPRYAELTAPRPLGIAQVQDHLRPGEALVAIHTGDNESYVWAVPAGGRAAFAVVGLNRERLMRMVAGLRAALDPKPLTLGDIPDFDTETAFELYNLLLKPVAAGWQDARDLLLVAHGPLGQLPFSILPTEPVRLGQDSAELFGKYRQVPWLVRKVSLTRLPSAAALVNLRSVPVHDARRKAFAGFGDPFFNKRQLTDARKHKEKAAAVAADDRQLMIRGIRVSSNGLLDSDAINSCKIDDLKRLPDTSEEITFIAETLGANPEHDVFLGDRASEQQVKSMDLSDRRVIAFATHALVPGDLDGLDQPALALCSPRVAGGKEDGLLTMGEILRLNLNADWVVLSACNTGAADGRGAEAISGLGQAFFYAGTRAILVSMWPVETTSARELTTGLFKCQRADPTLSRPRALRKTALTMIDELSLKDPATGKTAASYAHPLFWAPFIVVGESGGNAP